MTEPVPQGINVPYEYYDADDMTRRRDVADYVAEPITTNSLERRREREQHTDDD